jgi:hypothetical protein
VARTLHVFLGKNTRRATGALPTVDYRARRTERSAGTANVVVGLRNRFTVTELTMHGALGSHRSRERGRFRGERESGVIQRPWKSRARIEIRDVQRISRCCMITYVRTGAVSRTPINCALFAAPREAEVPAPPPCQSS